MILHYVEKELSLKLRHATLKLISVHKKEPSTKRDFFTSERVVKICFKKFVFLRLVLKTFKSLLNLFSVLLAMFKRCTPDWRVSCIKDLITFVIRFFLRKEIISDYNYLYHFIKKTASQQVFSHGHV